jgi:exopolysaccharide production protein ExoY
MTVDAATDRALGMGLTSSVDLLDRASPASASDLAKRVFDLLVASLLLLALAPLMILISVLIKLDSKGSVLFRQERMGARKGRGRAAEWRLQPFTVLKFRSMYENADESIHEAHIRGFVSGQIDPEAGGAGAAFKVRADARVTRIGKLLRRTSLDELPQLINVLRGDMSIVGPRPVPPYEAAYYTGKERERFATLPGITGLWQVRGRCDLSCAEMIRLDCEYVRRRSIWLDLKILSLTIPAVLTGRGAS